MNFNRSLSGLVAAAVAMLLAGESAATANLGGVVALVGGLGTCNYSKLVPLDTLQDTFLLSGATGCSGTAASVDMHGEAATAKVGLRASSSGNGFGNSQAAAQVYFRDHWFITLPAGSAVGTYTIPVSLTLEGSISPGSLSGFNRFMDYSMSIRDLYSGLSPSTLFTANGSIAATGVFSQVFSGSVDFRYFGPGSALPTTAEVVTSLFLLGLNEGVLDFYNTASISMQLPAGFSATTSSGVQLVFAPVPEPATYALMLAGLGLVAWEARRRRRDLWALRVQ